MSYNFEKTDNGIFRLKLTANAKKIIADLRRPLEILMKGNTINHPDLTVSAVQLLLSHDGVLIQLVILKERLENLYCTRRTPRPGRQLPREASYSAVLYLLNTN